jgi:hypothetical protein
VATILSAYDRGSLYGRCDASCYDGTKTECACICGGVNHGVGMVQALANTAAMSDGWLKRDRNFRHSRSVTYETPLVTQKSLF